MEDLIEINLTEFDPIIGVIYHCFLGKRFFVSYEIFTLGFRYHAVRFISIC